MIAAPIIIVAILFAALVARIVYAPKRVADWAYTAAWVAVVGLVLIAVWGVT